MVFRRYVSIGKVALVNYGPDAGKLCTIVNVCDRRSVLVQGDDVARQLMPLSRLSLTDLNVSIGLNARAKALKAAHAKAKTVENFNKSAWGQTLKKRETKANLSDFDRFKSMIAKKKKSYTVNREFLKLKKAAKV